MAWYDEPKYNRTLSSAGYLIFCLLYVVASVLPFLMLAFAAGVALGCCLKARRQDARQNQWVVVQR